METLNLYNTVVRLKISEKYKEASLNRRLLQNERDVVIKRMKDKEITYGDFLDLKKRLARLDREIIEADTEFRIWDEARELCLDTADEINNAKKEK